MVLPVITRTLYEELAYGTGTVSCYAHKRDFFLITFQMFDTYVHTEPVPVRTYFLGYL